MAPRKREPPPHNPPAAAGVRPPPPGEDAPAAAQRAVTWPRDGLPAGSGYLVAPAGPLGSGRPEVRIAVPEGPAGEADALGRALQDPAVAAAVGPRAAYEDIIPAEEVFRELDAADAAASSRPRGRVQLRLPVSLHAALAARAQAEGVSLNTLLVAYVARQLGQQEPPASGAA